jgi:hypothetical protein
MKKVKLIPLTIDRNKWARGGYNGEAALLNDDGNMCCLGFACRASGLAAKTIKGIGLPGDLPDESLDPVRMAKKLGKLVKRTTTDGIYSDGRYVDDAVCTNDDNNISESMREYRLKPILKKLGFSVKFVGPTRKTRK